jgi:hypothetical protein
VVIARCTYIRPRHCGGLTMTLFALITSLVPRQTACPQAGMMDELLGTLRLTPKWLPPAAAHSIVCHTPMWSCVHDMYSDLEGMSMLHRLKQRWNSWRCPMELLQHPSMEDIVDVRPFSQHGCTCLSAWNGCVPLLATEYGRRQQRPCV